MAEVVKNLPAIREARGSIPGLGRSPGEGSGYPLQHSCLGGFQGQRSLTGYSPGGQKKVRQDRTTDTVTFPSIEPPCCFTGHNFLHPLLQAAFESAVFATGSGLAGLGHPEAAGGETSQEAPAVFLG